MSRPVAQMPSYYWPFAVALLGIVAILVYLPSLHYEFQFDDLANITKHFNIRSYTLRDLFSRILDGLVIGLTLFTIALGNSILFPTVSSMLRSIVLMASAFFLAFIFLPG